MAKSKSASKSSMRAFLNAGFGSGGSNRPTAAETRASERKRIHDQNKKDSRLVKERKPAHATQKEYGYKTNASGHKLNRFSILADDRNHRKLSNVRANGRIGVRKAKRDIKSAWYHTWIKFIIHNDTRNKFAKR